MKGKDRQFVIPYQFKFVGLGFLVLTVLFIVIIKTLPIEIKPEYKELVKYSVFSVLLLGLFLIAVAREKVEDERTFLLKTKAFAGGFAGAIVYVIIKPFINRLMDMPMEVTGQEVAMVMLFTNLITYYLQKFTGKE